MRQSFLFLALAGLAGCSGGGGSDSPTPPITPGVAAVSSVGVTASTSTVNVGGTVQFTATVKDANNTVLSGRSIAWSASPATRASVSSGGLLTAVEPGDVTVTATSEGRSGTATIAVAPLPPARVASITVATPATSVLAGGTVQLTATTRDAQGTVLTAWAVAWQVSPATRATVSASGLLTAVQSGDVIVIATSEGVSSTGTTVSVVDPRSIPVFGKPYVGEFPSGNFMDHDIPKEFVDVNGRFTTFWGEVHAVAPSNFTDGHSGYDMSMPTGTPLLSVGAGTITRVLTSNPPFFCPPLNRDVTDQASVHIEHVLPGGVRVVSWYVHMSQITVTVGQVVTAGQQIGLSGNTGCSTAPHLHFEVFRVVGNTNRTIDPFGWQGVGADPWETHVDGAASIQLWKAGEAPLLFRQNTFALTATPFAPLVMTKLVYEGVNDAANPNNEYVEFTLDTRMASTLSLNGYGLRALDNPTLDYRFPNGLTLTAAQPTVRLYMGTGTSSGLTVYMGRTAPLWPNNRIGNCLRVLYPTGMSALYFQCAP